MSLFESPQKKRPASTSFDSGSTAASCFEMPFPAEFVFAYGDCGDTGAPTACDVATFEYVTQRGDDVVFAIASRLAVAAGHVDRRSQGYFVNAVARSYDALCEHEKRILGFWDKHEVEANVRSNLKLESFANRVLLYAYALLRRVFDLNGINADSSEDIATSFVACTSIACKMVEDEPLDARIFFNQVISAMVTTAMDDVSAFAQLERDMFSVLAFNACVSSTEVRARATSELMLV